MLSMIQELQSQNQLLQATLTQTQQEVNALRADLLSSNIKAQDAINKIGEPAPPEPHPQMVETVIAEIKERDSQEYVKKEVRIGGLPDDWQTVELEGDEDSIFESTKIETRLKKAIPLVDIGEPSMVEVKGQQVVVRYLYLKEKIAVMKQARALKGTKIWMADELTPLQLKSKKDELAKVHEARRQGKWAVYRYGKALIEDFKTPKAQAKDPTPTRV